MIYGYARVSTAGQARDGNSLADQTALLQSAGATEVFSEHFTGMKMERPEFERVLSMLEPGDTLVVAKLDRFARNAADGYNTIKDLLDRGVKVHILNMGLIEDTPMGRLMLHVMLAFAEFERDMIVERTSAGKTAAKAKKGSLYREGRKPLSDSDEIMMRIELGETWDEIGISRASWYRYRKMLGITSADEYPA